MIYCTSTYYACLEASVFILIAQLTEVASLIPLISLPIPQKTAHRLPHLQQSPLFQLSPSLILQSQLEISMLTHSKSLTASTKPSKSSPAKKKETFLEFMLRKLAEAFRSVYLFSRRCLWVSSTGLMIVVLPFAFAYFMEMQKELAMIQAGMDSKVY